MSKVSCLFYRKLDKCFVEHSIKIHDMIIKMNEVNEILNTSFKYFLTNYIPSYQSLATSMV